MGVGAIQPILRVDFDPADEQVKMQMRTGCSAGISAVADGLTGHPGVTLFAKVLTCTADELLYAALRTRGKLTGTVRTPDVIDGKVDVGLDESIVGYSNDCLATATQLKIQIDPGSPFRARRVKPTDDLDGNGNVSCPEIQNVYGEAGVP